MYKIYADSTLIYDGGLEDFKIAKGSITLETNKSGSFTFSIYPDHFYYDQFVKKKTIIKVLKDNAIVFRGRVLNDTTDYYSNKVITCEGELGFFHDSIIKPYTFNGTPQALFNKFINDYNSQVDDFKKFKIGNVTVTDANNYIARSNTDYEDVYSNLFSRLIEDSTGGYFYITHGTDGTDDIPTINYLADFTEVSTQRIEFGSNLKDYTKTVKGDDLATVIIPLGKSANDSVLTISSVNNGKDYIEDAEAIKKYGRIATVVKWDDVTDANNLKTKATAKLKELIKQNITLELSALDLHLLDPLIKPLKINQYIPVSSTPHDFSATLLCNKQTIDLLKPDNDTVTLGYTYSSFTDSTAKTNSNVSSITAIRTSVFSIDKIATQANSNANKALSDYSIISQDVNTMSGAVDTLKDQVATNTKSITALNTDLSEIKKQLKELTDRISKLEG